MAYADLTSEQQQQLQDWLTVVRPMMGELARLVNHLKAAKTAYTGHISAILALLADVDSINNESGLTGATVVLKAEVDEVITDANALILTHDTVAKRELRDKFCGAANTLG